MTQKIKVFCYVVRQRDRIPELLVFDSLDEPGFEVPKGSLEPGETVTEAARREIREESGLHLEGPVEVLGSTTWHDEQQTFVLLRITTDTRDAFAHTVSGSDEDAGMVYAFQWWPIGGPHSARLVQGCGSFLSKLIDRLAHVP